VEAAGANHLPVLAHSGVSSYYFKKEAHLEKPDYADIPFIEALIAGFPGVSFIVGHSRLYQTGEVMRRLISRKNVWVDVSFQSPKIIRKLLDVFGPERVLFASDWPFGNPGPMIKIVKAACRGDQALEKLIFYDNAARLLGVTDGSSFSGSH